MPIRCGLLAILCLAMNTPAAIAQTAPTTSGQISAYSVDGLALGARVQSSNSGYREYKCSPSDQFDGFMWCQKARQQKERRGNYSVTYSLLHSRDGKIVYVNRFQAPAFFGPNEAEGDIQRYSRKLGESARITRMPHRSGVPDGILAAWGNVKLEPLDSASIAVLGKGGSPKKGYIVDFIGDFARSAKEGLPIYRVNGGAGFLWVASFDQKGRGTLRFAAVDASAFNPEPLPTPQADNPPNSAAQRATPEAAPAAANPAGAEVSHQQAEVAVTPNTATEVARENSAPAERDPLVAQTEIERLNAERAELGATIRRLEADKAAAEAKAHTIETTAYGVVFVLLLVAAGIGAFVFAMRQKQGPAGDHSSVTLETKEPSAAITRTESAIAGYPQQPDLKSDDGIAASVPETKEASPTETIEVIKSEFAATEDPQAPDVTGASVDASSPEPGHVAASVRRLGAFTGIMIVGTVSAGAIAAVLYAKGPNPYQGGDASRVSETNDSPWEFHAKNNDATNEMEAFVIGWQENGQGAGAEIIGECANRRIIFKATVLGRDATPSVELLWDDKLEDYRHSIGKFMQVIYLPISIKVNNGEAELIKRLQEGAYRNVIRLATLNLDPTPAATRVAQLDNNLSPAERTALASYYPETPLNIAEVRSMTMQFETSEGTMPIRIMMDDPAIRKFVRACQKQ